MFRKLVWNTIRNHNELYQLQARNHSQHAVTSSSSTATNDRGHNPYALLPEQIVEAVKLQPKLISAPPDLWQRTHETFINHGLDTIGFLRIVCGNPALLVRPPQKIISSIETWRSCQFGEKLLHLMLVKYPDLFDVGNEMHLLQHVELLRSLVGSRKNVWKLIMNSPDILEQSEESVTKKFEYIRERMRIEVPEIVKSEALSKPLAEIQCRHIFLERLGLFKPRSPKENPIIPSKNHRLYQICDTSEKTFATKVCHVRLEEYEAFVELYKRENSRDGEGEEDDLSSDDDDEY